MRKRCATLTSLARPHPTALRGKTQVKALELGSDAVDDRNFLIHCHALYVLQHVVLSLIDTLNQKMIYSAPTNETVFAYLD